jgi:lipopolysaccharide/colanic/teichoic acid biosynthesis glycosyltransferase
MAEGLSAMTSVDPRLGGGSGAAVNLAAPDALARAAERRAAGELVVLPAAVADTPEQAWLGYLDSAPLLSTGRIVYAAVIKRALDVVGAACLLVALAPVLFCIAAAIRMSGAGPAMYRQQRIGRFGVPFTVYKFRTMIDDRRKTDLPFVGTDRRQRHKSEADPRVTRVGALLRRTSLDELPQLINILRGEMSFIGPRPELPRIVARYQPWQHQRHLVRPGMSGWWQIHGRSDRPMHENTELDIYYVERLSLRLDLHIFVRTFKALFSRNGAF